VDAFENLVRRLAVLETVSASVTANNFRAIEMQLSRAEDKLLRMTMAAPMRDNQLRPRREL